jgi:hypothetical protein
MSFYDIRTAKAFLKDRETLGGKNGLASAISAQTDGYCVNVATNQGYIVTYDVRLCAYSAMYSLGAPILAMASYNYHSMMSGRQDINLISLKDDYRQYALNMESGNYDFALNSLNNAFESGNNLPTQSDLVAEVRIARPNQKPV